MEIKLEVTSLHWVLGEHRLPDHIEEIVCNELRDRGRKALWNRIRRLFLRGHGLTGGHAIGNGLYQQAA